MKLFNTTVRTNPLGLVLSVLTAVIAALILFKKETGSAAKELKKVSSETDVLSKRNAALEESFAKGASQIRSKVEPLIRILKDQNTHLQTRKAAYEELIRINPDFVGTVNKEFEATSALDAVYARLLEKLRLKMRAEANQKTMQGFYDRESEGIAKVVKLESELSKVRDKASKIEADADKYIGTDLYADKRAPYRDMLVEEARLMGQLTKAQDELSEASKELTYAENWRDKEIDRLENELSLLKEGTQKYIDTKNELLSLLGQVDITTTDPSKIKVPDAEAEKEAMRKGEALKKQQQKWRDEQNKADIENAKSLSEELKQLEQREIDDRLAIKQDGFDKERAQEANNHAQRMAELKKRLVDESVITNLEDRINDPETKPVQRGYLSHYKEMLLDKNKHINKLIEIEEQRHKLVTSATNDKQDADRISKMQAAYEREKVLAETDFNNQMAALGSNEVAKQKLQAQYDKAEIDRQATHLNKLISEKEKLLAELNKRIDLTALTPDQAQAMQDEIEKLKLQLSELAKAKSDLQAAQSSNDLGTAGRAAFGDKDILGYTPSDWESLYGRLDSLEGKLKFAGAAIYGMQNLWGMYNDFVAAGENRSLSNFERNADSKKRHLKAQLDNGYINQRQYQQQLEQMDAELEKKRAEIEYRQAKRQKTAAIFEASINTAKGITAAIPNVFLMALAAAAGALQVATIARQPLPARGYEKGLYPEEVVKREQDGKVFNARYGGRTRSGLVRRPTYFLTGENGPEMVIDAAAYRQMSPGTKDLLIRELRGIKGFEKGYYNNDVTGAPRLEVPASPSGSATTELLLKEALAVIAANTEVMRDIKENGIAAWIARDYRNYKDLQEDLDRLKDSRKKAQQ